MAEARMERRLAAILAADVAGHSRMIGQEKAATLDALKTQSSELIEPTIAKHDGRVVKPMATASSPKPRWPTVQNLP
jgi:adenylate cyclase